MEPDRIGHLLVHYDTIDVAHGRAFDLETYESDPATALFRYAEKITFITIRTTSGRLLAQLKRREEAASWRRPKLRRLYENERLLAKSYEAWLKLVAGFKPVTVGNYIVTLHPDLDYAGEHISIARI
jgi:hypothetical protein